MSKRFVISSQALALGLFALPAWAAKEKVQALPAKTLAQLDLESAQAKAKSEAKASTKAKASKPKIADADAIEAQLRKDPAITTPDSPAAAAATPVLSDGEVETKVLESVTQSQATVNSANDAHASTLVAAASTSSKPGLNALIATASALRTSEPPQALFPPTPTAELAAAAPSPLAVTPVLSSAPVNIAAVTTPALGVAPAFAPESSVPEPVERWFSLSLGLMASRWDKLDSKFPKGGVLLGARLGRKLSPAIEVSLGLDILSGASAYHGPDDIRGGYQFTATGRYYVVPLLYGSLGLAFGDYRAWSVKSDFGRDITYHRAASGTLAGLIPELGVSLPIARDLRAELGANYTWYVERQAAKIGNFGLRAALGFKL